MDRNLLKVGMLGDKKVRLCFIQFHNSHSKYLYGLRPVKPKTQFIDWWKNCEHVSLYLPELSISLRLDIFCTEEFSF